MPQPGRCFSAKLLCSGKSFQSLPSCGQNVLAQYCGGSDLPGQSHSPVLHTLASMSCMGIQYKSILLLHGFVWNAELLNGQQCMDIAREVKEAGALKA